jgi:hypothetical protein
MIIRFAVYSEGQAGCTSSEKPMLFSHSMHQKRLAATGID